MYLEKNPLFENRKEVKFLEIIDLNKFQHGCPIQIHTVIPQEIEDDAVKG